MFFNNINRRFFMPDPSGGAASPEDVQNQQKLNSELSETEEIVLDIRNAWRSIGAEISEVISGKMKELKGSAKSVATSIKSDIVKSLQEQSKESSRILSLQNKQINGSIKTADVEKRLEASREKQRNIVFALEEAVREGVISEETKNKKIAEANEQYYLQKKTLDEINKKAEEFERKLGLTYKIFEGINKIPILNALVKVDKVQRKMEEAAAAGKSTWGVFGAGVKETFIQIGKSLTDPLVIVTGIFSLFGMIIKAAFELDKKITDLAKNLYISKEGAKLLYDNFRFVSLNSDKLNKNLEDAAISMSSMAQAVGELNESLGTAEYFTSKQVADQIVMTKQMGFTVEMATDLQKLGLLQNKSAEQLTTEIGDQIVAFKKEAGVQLSLKKVTQDILKVSGQLSANLGNDPKRIAAAVMQAQKLGITLEQSRKISESLLNFESSIENELEAELITGKRLNFERARALALQGKTTEAAKELMDQMGGLSEFQQLNVIQQGVIAKSIGLSADEMADAYKQQELLKGTAFKTKEAFEEQARLAAQQGKLEEFQAQVRYAANGEQLVAMAAQIGAQERFNMAIEKLKETLVSIVGGPLLGMVEKFTKFISDSDNIKMILDGVYKVFNAIKLVVDAIAIVIGIKLYQGMVTFIAQLVRSLALAVGLAASTAGIMSAITLGVGAVAIIAGINSIMGAMNDAEKAFTPKVAQDLSLSGNTVISSPLGTFITDPRDDIVAAPGAASMVGGGGISRSDIEAIANRPIIVRAQMNSEDIMTMNTVQSQYSSTGMYA